VTLFFKDKLYRGNRATKVDAFGLDAFDSPNFPPLGTFGLVFVPDWNLIRKPNHKKFKANKVYSKRLAVLKFFPTIQASVIRSVLNSDIDGNK
jgi:L-asparaginase/archaeal Glu-tRNAGln amidotransferase subunit D